MSGNARTGTVLLLLLGFGVFVGTLDQTVVVTILPQIISGIELPVSKFGQATWIVNGYLLGYTIALPIIGRLGDVYGKLRMYLICLGLLVAGSAAVALAPNIQLLVAARALQAIGAGGVLPLAIAIAADLLSAGRRSMAIGGLAATNNASSLLGPLWGAALIGQVGWRGIFWLNIPLIVPVAVAALLFGRTIQPLWKGERQRVDWAGAALLTASLAAATLALTDDGADPRPAIVSIAIGLSALLLLLVFIRTEWLAERPMIRLQSFSEPHFAAAMAMYFLLGGALIVALVDVPLMANLLFQASAVQGGLALMRLLLLLPLGGVVGGWACNHIGRRATAAAGVTLAIIGFLLMRSWPTIPSSRDLWLSLGAIGFGLGLCDAPIVTTVVDTVRRTERATASALLLVLWTSGMIVGLGLLGTRGLSSFSARAAALFREQGANLDLAAIQRIERQTFNGTLVGAIVALALALGLTLLLETGRSHSMRWNPLTATEE